MHKKRVCPSCSKENREDANFCAYCSAKITETCLRCWIKKDNLITVILNNVQGISYLYQKLVSR
ncbi:zinc-ribbon domain-containing protein [Clostridium amylolyticum]|uniref:zinc-ribbon domain-containing protein n=1 Tax=Clostridium amylolyticum TaxID=1121298 RepID=UPI000932F3BD|nr:zinc-ribbon domain-containing protein [Clostridium amylolyticum]